MLDALATRWGVAPWEIEDDDHLDWLMAGMEFVRMEGSVRRGK